MRQGQKNRSRGRNNNNNNRRPGGMPNRNQTYDSNGPDVRIRGSAYQVHEKYLALARDAQAAGDRITAENYLQHAEHYFRIIAQIQEAQGQRPPYQGGQGGNDFRREFGEGGFDEEGDGEAGGEGFEGGEGQPQPQYQQREHRGDGQQDRGNGRENGRDREYRGEGRGEQREPRGEYRGDRNDGQPREGREQREPRGERRDDRPERAERPDRDGGERAPREQREAREPREPREPREAREPRAEARSDEAPAETPPRPVRRRERASGESRANANDHRSLAQRLNEKLDDENEGEPAQS